MQSGEQGQVPFTVLPPGVSKINDYDVIDILSKGEYGIVYRGLYKAASPPLPVAIKTLFYNKMPREMQEMAARECGLNKSLVHTNVIACYDAFLENGELHIILEQAGGDLESAQNDLREKGGSFCEKDVWKMQYFMANALTYLHSNNIVHRDIRPSNLQLTSSGHLKLADLGAGIQGSHRANQMSGQKSQKSFLHQSGLNAVGCYTPPEVIQGEPWTQSSDIWSAGVVLYELCTLTLPYQAARSGGEYFQLANQIQTGAYDVTTLREGVNVELVELIDAMQCKNVANRPDANSLLVVAKRVLQERKGTSGNSSSNSSSSNSSSNNININSSSGSNNSNNNNNNNSINDNNIRSKSAQNISSNTSNNTNEPQHPHIQLDLSSVVLQDRIAQGNQSSVYRATARDMDGQEMVIAVKEVFGDAEHLDSIEREVVLLQRVEHKQIQQCYGLIRKWSSVWLQLEFCPNGDLGGQVRVARAHHMYLPEAVLWQYQRHAAGAQRHCHAQRVVHRDVKPDNQQQTKEQQLKQADLGVSRQLHSTAEQAYSAVGTPVYMAPEAIAGLGVTAASDVWGLGSSFYELATFEPPFSCTQSQFNLSQAITSTQVPTLARIVPATAQALMIRLARSETDPAESERRAQFSRVFGISAPEVFKPPTDGQLFRIAGLPFTDAFIPPNWPGDARSFLSTFGCGLYSARFSWLISAMLHKAPADRPDCDFVYQCASEALHQWGVQYQRAGLKAVLKLLSTPPPEDNVTPRPGRRTRDRSDVDGAESTRARLMVIGGAATSVPVAARAPDTLQHAGRSIMGSSRGIANNESGLTSGINSGKGYAFGDRLSDRIGVRRSESNGSIGHLYK